LYRCDAIGSTIRSRPAVQSSLGGRSSQRMVSAGARHSL